MEIRKAEQKDIEMLTNNRLEFVCSIRNIQNPEVFKEETGTYINNHLNDGSLLAYLALDEGKIIASSILCIYNTLPTPSCYCGKCGLLLNVYTLKEYRRKGIASKLIKKLIEEARTMGVGKILLDYTDDGHPLYQSLGFEELDRQMVLRLT